MARLTLVDRTPYPPPRNLGLVVGVVITVVAALSLRQWAMGRNAKVDAGQ